MSLGELREAAIIATVIDRVSAVREFCGETFIQKSTFFLKELFGIPFEAKFRLYYFGPFSFDLREQLQSLEAYDIVKVRPHQWGANYVTGERYETLQHQFPKTLAQYERGIDFVVQELAPLGVKDLEPLATALFLTREKPSASIENRAQELHTIKPHVDLEQARKSVKRIDAWMESVAASSATS
jgi:hypothetical protein